jgi:hypothetical protein
MPDGELITRFVGAVTLTTTHPRAAGPYTAAFEAQAIFNPARDRVRCRLRPIVTPEYETGTLLGKNRTTVTMLEEGEGRFDAASGQVDDLRISLKIDHSIDAPFYEEDSVVNDLVLSTRPPGAPLDRRDGAVTVAGAGTFTGGILNGHRGSFVLAGTLERLP